MLEKVKLLAGAPLRFGRALRHAFQFHRAGEPFLAPKPVQADRAALCRRCPHHANGFCGLCACLTQLKVKLSSEQCPDSPPRWRALARRPGPDW